ncbi:uncharacterized protein LOC127804454 [Diospyros lotus]|uniref:uncharacterized protein LOC127804454 n=1 Tax=Diospyros lotus TaxID=55363 RepID=UPI00225AC37C|nr:uncharacterized protein LOC127804454 [Diospyros lotus]
MEKWEKLRNPNQYIERRIHQQTEKEKKQNRLLVMTSIESVKWLALQGCAFRGHDESTESTNRGNFIELIKSHGRANNEIDDVVLEKAAKNAKYTSPVDESHNEQMAIILRYVDSDGFVRERFFEVVSVKDTNALTLKKEICVVLRQYNLLITNLQGQGYDGASNMRGEWNGLQALFLRECPSAYYVHCFAHRLQLALVVVAKDRAGATRWSSHFASVKRFIEMFGSTCTLLENLINEGSNNSIRGEAKGALKVMKTFDFAFILLLMHEVLEKSDILCQALQMKDQDILNAMHFVSSTKLLLQEMCDDRWESFIWYVVEFCRSNDIDVPELTDRYMDGTRRSCQQKNNITVEDYYHFQIFNAVIDFQLMELNNRFMEKTIELLKLYEALNPTDRFKSFSIDAICGLAEEFYPLDFNKEEIPDLKRQLDHYKFDVIRNP